MFEKAQSAFSGKDVLPSGTDSFTDGSDVEALQSGVHDDLAGEDRIQSALNGRLGLLGGILVVVLVGDEADAALGDTEVDFLTEVGAALIELVDGPDQGSADVLEAGGIAARSSEKVSS